MSDIRGFTSMSERMPPENLIGFLNASFSAMIDIILANEGTLEKFMGEPTCSGQNVNYGRRLTRVRSTSTTPVPSSTSDDGSGTMGMGAITPGL